MKRVKEIVRDLWTNRKAEIALVASAIALAREIVQATGN